MRPVRGIVLLGAAWALSGCGATQRDEVQAKVQQFARATAAGDYVTLCQQVLAPSLIQRLQGADLSCQQAMRVFVRSVKNPTLSIAKITVQGQRASAVVLAAATGQRAALTTIQLIDTKQGWRLASLASPS
jgi:hypothetical protein